MGSIPVPWGSPLWRLDGGADDYWASFWSWFRSLPQPARDRFALDQAEPPDWRYFYEYMGLDDDAAQRRAELEGLMTAARQDYQSAEYQRGLVAEEAGQLDQALTHYGNVFVSLGLPRVPSQGELDEALTRSGNLVEYGEFRDAVGRYERLRQRLTGDSTE